MKAAARAWAVVDGGREVAELPFHCWGMKGKNFVDGSYPTGG